MKKKTGNNCQESKTSQSGEKITRDLRKKNWKNLKRKTGK